MFGKRPEISLKWSWSKIKTRTKKMLGGSGGLPGDVLRVKGTAKCLPRTETSPFRPAGRRCRHAFPGWRRAACGPDARGSMVL